MKKLVFALFAFLLVGSISAQDHEKAYKKARKLLANYNIDNSKIQNLSQAREKIDYALTGDLSGIKNPHDPYIVKGDIYNSISSAQYAALELKKQGLGEGIDESIKIANPATHAHSAYVKALDLSTKGGHKKKALKGLRLAQNNLYNEGLRNTIETKDYEAGYMGFKPVLDIHKVLKENDHESFADAEKDYNSLLYLISFTGANVKKYDEIKPVLIELYEKEYSEALVYTLLYSIEAKTDKAAAVKYLEKGRTLFPDDTDILIAEINHYLNEGKLDEMISKLNKAIELQPENISLYTTLANVYDQLHNKEKDAGNEDKANEYFEKALAEYNRALTKDPENVYAQYSIGALYYNKAAGLNKEMIALSNDFSKAATKKYDELKQESLKLFEQALPYFKKAEIADPNDLNTLIALKEIFAKTDDIPTSNEFKTRLETVQGGGTNTSYFKGK